jgi:hypothetical protein
MSTKRSWLILLFASAILLACAIGLHSNDRAQAAAPQEAGIILPYTGRLTDTRGLPVSDGVYDFTFALYDAAAGGAPTWSETQTGVAVQAGSFSVQLGSATLMPASARDGQKWLGVSVRGAGEAQFTPLDPRQALSTLPALAPASPSVGPSCAHNHLGEDWGSGATQYSSAVSALYISNYGTGNGLTVTSYGGYGIVGMNQTSGGTGVLGMGSNGKGVIATSSGLNGVGLEAVGTTAIKADGKIISDAGHTVYLSPQQMVARGSTGMTLTPGPYGEMIIRNVSGLAVKVVALPVSTFGTLFGSPLYVESMEVCYKVFGVAGKITETGLFKNAGEDLYATYLYDGVQKVSSSRQCYTINSAIPRTVIDNSTWVQFSLNFTGEGAQTDVTIYSVKLNLSELANPSAPW